jgi:hypothetical protein
MNNLYLFAQANDRKKTETKTATTTYTSEAQPEINLEFCIHALGEILMSLTISHLLEDSS